MPRPVDMAKRLGPRSAPGRLVSIGTHKLHLHCAGTGMPAVIFDAALGASSLSWSLVQPLIAEVTQACAYDRAGFGWSEAGPLPRTAGRIADELHALLQEARVPPPYVLVGHSFGGLVSRLFAARHPDLVAAIVLIEPAIPEDWVEPSPQRRALIARGTRLCRVGSTAARYGVAAAVGALVRAGALAPARALVSAVSRGGFGRADEAILAPIWKLPAEARQSLAAMWTRPGFFEALGSQIAHISDSAAEVLAADPHLDDLLLVVMTAATADPARLEADAAMARRAALGRHVRVPQSGHWVPLDAPHAVAAALKDVVARVRAR